MPIRIPYSLIGDIEAQLAATKVIHAPLPNPYPSRPINTTASGRLLGVQSPKRENHRLRHRHPANRLLCRPDIRRHPRRQVRRMDRLYSDGRSRSYLSLGTIRPTKEPVCRMAMA
jgi:hypothetical protein